MRIISHRVAPRASAASFWSAGTVMMTSREIAETIGKSLFDQGYTLAAVIANEFGEAASSPIHRAALIAAGLVLFVLTLIVNALARILVNRNKKSREIAAELAV